MEIPFHPSRMVIKKENPRFRRGFYAMKTTTTTLTK
jgi:hypothetical protein